IDEGRTWHARSTGFQVIEVIFVKDHAVVLKAKPPRELRVGRKFFFINLTVCQNVRNLFVQLVYAFDISLVELEMHLERFIRNPFQSTQIELLGFVSSPFNHSDYSFSLVAASYQTCSRSRSC